MQKKFLDHSLSIIFILTIFSIFFIYTYSKEIKEEKDIELFRSFIEIKGINYDDTLHRELFKDTYELFNPNSQLKGDTLLNLFDNYRADIFSNPLYKTGIQKRSLSLQEVYQLLNMYAVFIIIYLIVMILSYYSTQTLAIFFFVKQKQEKKNEDDLIYNIRNVFSKNVETSMRLHYLFKSIGIIFKNIISGIVMLILFAPAYVIAYSMKSTFETGGYLFMILLGVISNGVLINYAYKFYTFLLHESQKGYVETAIVKGLNNSYEWNKKDGISISSLLKLKKKFPNHVFQHIYENARFQNISTMKQYASFIITGLIIIEMALNIQGHLCYELLKDVLYRRYTSVIFIIFLIFLLVKGTEMLIDYWYYYESKKYEN